MGADVEDPQSHGDDYVKTLLPIAAASALLAAAAPSLAQPGRRAPLASPGVPNDTAVNPAPGAVRPYLGHPGRFYDPAERLQAIDGRIGALAPARRRAARADVRRIHAFADGQRARHGDLRDWDRERMTVMMDRLVAVYPELRG